MFQTWHSSSSSHMHVMNHNWSSTKQRLHPQSVAEMSRHSVMWQNMALTSSDGSGWWRTLAWMVSRSCWQSTNRCTQTLHALAGTGMAVTKLYTTCNNTFHHISSKHQVHASMTATNHSVQHLHHKVQSIKTNNTLPTGTFVHQSNHQHFERHTVLSKGRQAPAEWITICWQRHKSDVCPNRVPA